MALFEAHRLHKRFGRRVVLEDISLAFADGRISGIMGPNGAGKTTCFNVLTGRYAPDRGRVVLDGRDIAGKKPHEIARLGVSRSFQMMNLFDEYTARENVAMALPAMRGRGFQMARAAAGIGEIRDAADAALERVGLAGRGDAIAKALSYGERRALEIGVALAAAPRILFLDEPTSGLGTEATARLAELIRRLKGSLAMVLIEHDMRFLFELADEVSVIHWGQVIARGTPDELRRNPWVQRSNLGKLA
ncbi:MAG: ABC transporter ATP-binding protein [Alphaproteobacteria bacterium]|nr:ABC transporter ATP-binding protein [Alphaproteobacteria bacterium]